MIYNAFSTSPRYMDVIFNDMREHNTVYYIKNNIIPKQFYNLLNIDEDYTLAEFLNFGYVSNNCGFRGKKHFDYNNEPNEIWCFGCSWTWGSGVPERLSWPSLVQQQTINTVKNFGVAGSGPQTCLRLLKHWLSNSKHKPRLVLIHGFFSGRVELFLNETNGYFNVPAETYKTSVKKLKKLPNGKELIKQLDDSIIENDTLYDNCVSNIESILKSNHIKYNIINVTEMKEYPYGGMLYGGSAARDIFNVPTTISYLRPMNFDYEFRSGEEEILKVQPHPGPKVHSYIKEKILTI